MQRVVFDGKWNIAEFHRHDDFPHVAPFLAIENIVWAPVHSPTFCFSTSAVTNIIYIQEIKNILVRLDNFIKSNQLNQHPCIISQAGAQSTMRLASKTQLRADWATTVELPFCFYVTERGTCPRMFDYEDIYKQTQWLLLFEEVLLPLDRMNDSTLTIIAPHQSSEIVKDALMKTRAEKTKWNSKIKVGTDRRKFIKQSIACV